MADKSEDYRLGYSAGFKEGYLRGIDASARHLTEWIEQIQKERGETEGELKP